MKCVIYYKKSDINEAVSYYMSIMERAFNNYFRVVTRTSNIDGIDSDEVVAVISHRCFWEVLKKNRKQKIIFWWQGVAPEEIIFGQKKMSLYLRIKYLYLCGLEYLFLRYSSLNLFVSESMLRHYKTKYGYKKDNYIIMPCFNQKINEDSFRYPNKYVKPSFVYAGGIQPWQCIDEALQLYAMVKLKYPDASMTLLTKDEELAQKLITKHSLADVTIKFVALENLNNELAKYKYGMLLRSDDPVNNVATPTKFNSYLAVGSIPIISRTIGDYGRITERMKYVICVKDENDLQAAFDQIDCIEQQKISPEAVFAEYKEIFNYYYNEDHYIELITGKLKIFFQFD